MKVLYDHQIFSMQNFGGISRYFYENIIRLRKNFDVEIDHSILYSSNEYLIDRTIFPLEKPYGFQDWIPWIQFRGKYRIFRLMQILGLLPDPKSRMNKEILRKIERSDFDLFHPTYYSSYFLKNLRKIRKPFVLTVYDLIHEKFPSYFPDANDVIRNKKILIENAVGIIAISENTKSDLIQFYNFPENKIKVVYLGSSFSSDLKTNKNSNLFKKEYLLFTGNRSHYKNFSFFLKSIQTLFKEFPSLQLYCVGGGSFQKEEIVLVEELGLTGRVEQFHFESDDELSEYYKNALLFVFPSRYEGFGIPLLEAFSCRTPVVCSETSSFPEVAGDAAFYFDPDSKESIYESVKEAILSPEKRKEKIQNGIRQINQFSWDKSAKGTFEFYQSIYKG